MSKTWRRGQIVDDRSNRQHRRAVGRADRRYDIFALDKFSVLGNGPHWVHAAGADGPVRKQPAHYALRIGSVCPDAAPTMTRRMPSLVGGLLRAGSNKILSGWANGAMKNGRNPQWTIGS